MEDQETQVVEQITENTEQTAEQTPKTFTQPEVDEIVKQRLDEVLPGKIARKEAKIRKETDREYGEMMGLLRTATGKETVQEITDHLREYYGSRGVTPKAAPEYSQEDIAVLADADAKSIIRGGYEEVVEEVDRLAKLGTARMTPREKATFTALAQYRQSQERGRELEKLGVPAEVYNGKEFQNFAAKFSTTTPVTEIYGIYEKTLPKQNIQTMGSVKNTDSGDGGVKDFYSFEEASKFNRKDFERNPALLKAVERSMTKWK